MCEVSNVSFTLQSDCGLSGVNRGQRLSTGTRRTLFCRWQATHVLSEHIGRGVIALLPQRTIVN